MRISVKALPVHDILKDLARQWNVALKVDSGELLVNLPATLGEGFVRGTSFESGLGIIEYHCRFLENYEILFSIVDTHPLKFMFCSEGTIDHSFQDDPEIHCIQTYQNIIVSSSGHKGHLLRFTAGEKSHVTSIEIVRTDFSKRNNYQFEGLEPVLKELFRDSTAENQFFYQGNYSIKAADIVEEIANKQLKGFLGSIFLEGKLFELLVVQIIQYQDDQREDVPPQILRQADVEKIKKAAALINNNLNENYSVDRLAEEVGTNVNRLQDGFKYLYDLTVNKYVQQVKLEAARRMLNNPEYNVSDIVSLIGLNNRSYFSKIFKEKYGVSPKYFLAARKEKGMQ